MHGDTIQVHLSNTVITYDAHPLYYEVKRHNIIALCRDQKSECMNNTAFSVLCVHILHLEEIEISRK